MPSFFHPSPTVPSEAESHNSWLLSAGQNSGQMISAARNIAPSIVGTGPVCSTGPVVVNAAGSPHSGLSGTAWSGFPASPKLIVGISVLLTDTLHPFDFALKLSPPGMSLESCLTLARDYPPRATGGYDKTERHLTDGTIAIGVARCCYANVFPLAPVFYATVDPRPSPVISV